MKRQPTKSKKMCANLTSVKMLICKIYKEHIQLKGQKNLNNPMKNGKTLINRHFSKKVFKWPTVTSKGH